jgi:hypothetical protein
LNKIRNSIKCEIFKCLKWNIILNNKYFVVDRVLSHNPITQLEPNSFVGLSNLTELWETINTNSIL